MTDVREILIIGAGQAGACAAQVLRAVAYRGKITMLGSETHLPYERPQLSKELLLQERATPKYMRDAEGWAALDVEINTGCEVSAWDPDKRLIALPNGREFGYDRLLIATGTHARRLPDLESGPVPVQYLRKIEDAIRLRPYLEAICDLVLIGGGVIGLEVAAAAAERGCRVTIVEASAHLLPQVGSPDISAYFAELHGQHGVRIRTGVHATASEVGGIRLSDGSFCSADLAVVGIGVEPSAGFAESAGLTVSTGIAVDPSGMTAIDDVYAAGDVALQWNSFHGRALRIENWANAQNQAAACARSMIGADVSYDAVPWFWSDQYKTNLQVAGTLRHVDHVLRGDPRSGSFAVIGLRDGEAVGAATINRSKDMSVLRRIVAMRGRPNKDDLANPAFDLRSTLKK